ncbi:hypothetical protein [Halorientalis sp. IM1011]|uniref:hypothetical protein n=1 Tax=Halorientalis sp. IM1011 TaxID=1932360 RepID=UPI0012FCBE6F|nr:hypothetical protein [Halorientalis sp. IM1011]
MALVLGGLAAAFAGALVYLPLGFDWPAALAVAGAVYVLLLVETVLEGATFGGS